ncbi:multiheme c-type cytochrome [candidate division KSB1 bacterium]
MKNKFLLLVIILFVLTSFGLYSFTPNDLLSPQEAECMVCHQEITPGIYNQWYSSSHAENGVTCYECHAASEDEPDAFEHNGEYVATLVTPGDCGNCHYQEMEEVSNSYHATAGEILESNDSYLAHTAGGLPVAIVGCESCHGATIKIDEEADNKLSLETWPNSGIGRINPDGSKGACNACHTRHAFSKAQARQPAACSKCHLGPDHPQKEVYEESKHGNSYFTNVDKMNLESYRWIVGVDYNVAPTCATCHMSATQNQPATHDVGRRISWTLRPVISVKKENWEEKRENMQDVCISCHVTSFAEGHYYQFDAVVELYNQKFAQPAREIMNIIRERGLLENPADFSNNIEWTFWEIWHHEGRTTRHGAAMMAPDYAWWHGMYEVAKHFYFKFIPEAREYNDPEVNAYIDDMLASDPMHQWLSRSTTELVNEIRSGRMQEIYQSLFRK